MACDHCQESKPVMVPMAPGKDGVPWELCSSCWIEGRQPMKLGRFKVTEIADDKLYDALTAHAKRTASMIEHPPDAAQEQAAKKPPRQKRSR